MIALPEYNELDIKNFSLMLNRQGLTNSYKLLFFKAILECCKNGNDCVSFETLYDFMFEEAFPLIHTFKLKFSSQDLIERRIKDFSNANSLNMHQIRRMSEHIPANEKENIITSYVVFRLLRPFYREETQNTQDHLVNSRLHSLINSDAYGLYLVDLDKHNITLNPKWVNYIKLHLKLIEEWYKYNLIVFLQSRNPSVPNIAFKVDSSLVSRSLSKQTKLWQFASNIDASIAFDIYLNKPFDSLSISHYGKLSLDHVIPFDFVMHNELWNLTPMHKNLNSMKNNQLPRIEHIERLISLQYSFFKTLQIFYPQKKNEIHPLSDYEELNSILSLSNLELHEDEFSMILRNLIHSLHTIALNQGFNLWNQKEMHYQ